MEIYNLLKEIHIKGELIKKKKNRKLFKLDHLLIKIFKPKHIFDWFWFISPKKEFHYQKMLSSLNLAPKIFGIYRRKMTYILVSEFLYEYETLQSWLKKHPWNFLEKEKKQQLLTMLAELITKFWKIGIIQTDFNQNNILINKNNLDIKLIDFQRVKFIKNPQKRIWEQLSYLLPPFQDEIPFHSRAWFFRMLRKKIPELQNVGAWELFYLGEKAYFRRIKYWKKFKKRLLNRKQILILKKQKIKIFLNAKKSINLEDIFKILKILENKKTEKTLFVKINDLKYWIKIEKGWTNKIIKKKLKKTWWNFWKLKIRNIPTPEPLSYIETPQGNYLITEFIEAPRLKDFLKQKKPLPKGHLKKLAYLIWDLHQKGLTHGDLKASNILYCPKKETFWLIDLEDVEEHYYINKKDRLKDLIPLLASFEDHFPESFFSEIFIKYYLHFHRPLRKEYQKIIKELKFKAQEVALHRKRRRGEL